MWSTRSSNFVVSSLMVNESSCIVSFSFTQYHPMKQHATIGKPRLPMTDVIVSISNVSSYSPMYAKTSLKNSRVSTVSKYTLPCMYSLRTLLSSMHDFSIISRLGCMSAFVKT